MLATAERHHHHVKHIILLTLIICNMDNKYFNLIYLNEN
jgi:hypothetical protein